MVKKVYICYFQTWIDLKAFFIIKSKGRKDSFLCQIDDLLNKLTFTLLIILKFMNSLSSQVILYYTCLPNKHCFNNLKFVLSIIFRFVTNRKDTLFAKSLTFLRINNPCGSTWSYPKNLYYYRGFILYPCVSWKIG